MSNEEREKQITRTSLIGIGANLCLAGFKALVGFLAGSIAIVLDAVNNLTDALSSVITIAGVKLAKKKPDREHPYGHGRIEYISAILIAVIILTAGGMSLVESVKKIISPGMPDYSSASLIVISSAILVKIFLGRYVSRQGRKYNSDALVASGADASFDAIISASTLAGAIIAMTFHIVLDGWIGAVISCFILKAGVEMLLESFGSMLGARPDSETTKAIKARVRSIDRVQGAYDLILHNYGPNSAIGSIHVEVADTMSAIEMHRLTKTIQTVIEDEFHIFMTVGFYVVDSTHTEQRNRILNLSSQKPGVMGIHGVFINDTTRYVSFDVVIDFTADSADIEKSFIDAVHEFLPGYRVVIHFDRNFSD